MFAVVKVREKEKSFRNRFRKNTVTAEKICLPNSSCFFVITAEITKNIFPIDEIMSFSDKLKRCLIFEKSAPVSYKDFRPERLKKKLLFLYAQKHLQNAAVNPFETSVCLCDSDGLYSDELHKLLPFASKLHVVSSDYSYLYKAQELLAEYGVSVTVSKDFDKRAEKSTFIISHSTDMISVGCSGVIITNEPKLFPLARCITVPDILLPEAYERLIPAEIDKSVFASALYEKCFCEDILQFCAERM